MSQTRRHDWVTDPHARRGTTAAIAGARSREYRSPVRRFRMVAMVLAMTAAVSGCGGGDGGGSGDGSASNSAAATTVPVPSTAAGTTVPPTDLTLRITDVRLVNSEESDSGMRVLLPAGVATASV